MSTDDDIGGQHAGGPASEQRDAEHASTKPAPFTAFLRARGLSNRVDAFRAALTDWEQTIAKFLLGYGAVLGALVVTGILNLAYFLFLLSLAGMYILLAMGLNVQWGYAGLINFSVAAFFGIGAYATMLLSSPDSPILGPGSPIWRWPIVGIFVAVLAGAILGLMIGIPTLSLRDDYLAIATLGLAEVVRLVALNQREWTDGSRGIIRIDRFFEHWPVIGDYVTGLSKEVLNFLTVTAFVVIVWLILRRMHRSPWGRVQHLLRSDSDLAEALGKNTYRFRMQAFLLGCMIMALAGVFYAHLAESVFPSTLSPTRTFDVWIAAILGGTGSDNGAVIGGLIIISIIEGTRFIGSEALPVSPGSLRLFFIGVLIIVLMRYRPEGLLPPQRERIWPGATNQTNE